ncbi:MAG: sodium:solute symporter [Prolixibacteraceae bacterium]|nr:sodium:solute symporter [Prolixibacteraceae bacterium]NLT00375.1 sodium:solute symporter [Bacteroidales bacterium]OQB79941.1 MAG: Sodium/glucose cotransporter [Bacteroidetes bacterium ADurb.Bin123]HNZ70060.1 sodium:solute symporter [Prolixibacteraceae bacterium]HOC87353.1 sodium:solute symporter [Prolixibacteraceae bacterium]
MNPFLVFFIVAGYFMILLAIAWFTGRKATTDTFFIANRKSPWYLVAFAMIGATISGVTFISVPGEVGNSAFSYLQFVMGNVVGYWLVAGFLLPVYYRMNLISIYSFLGERLGKYSHKTGSFFFILSKLIGAAFRLYLAAGVLQIAFFDAFNIPFYVTVIVSIALIWVYTFKGGIKTIVWTDSLQTLFIVGAVVLTIIIISRSMGWDFGTMTREIGASPLSDIFTWDWRSGNNFFKQFFSGIFITLVIVGMDQDSMQKNLTCKSLREARKNMLVFSIAFIVTVFLFLCLGALLYLYAGNLQLQLPAHSDDVYPWLAFNKLGMAVGIAFLIGVIAAAYSSADSALTSLTTTLSIDFLKAEQLTEERRVKVKTRSHLAFSILLILVILAFRAVNDQSVVVAVFTVAGYTYGPILGLFLFGLLTKRKINDRWVPLIAVAAPALSYLISANSEKWLGGYTFGFEILILNGLLMISGLYIISKK